MAKLSLFLYRLVLGTNQTKTQWMMIELEQHQINQPLFKSSLEAWCKKSVMLSSYLSARWSISRWTSVAFYFLIWNSKLQLHIKNLKYSPLKGHSCRTLQLTKSFLELALKGPCVALITFHSVLFQSVIKPMAFHATAGSQRKVR